MSDLERLCDNCKYYINDAWTYPYCGIQVVVTVECRAPENIFEGKPELGPMRKNADHDCSWFEVGKHIRNNGGQLSAKESAEVSRSNQDFDGRVAKLNAELIIGRIRWPWGRR